MLGTVIGKCSANETFVKIAVHPIFNVSIAFSLVNASCKIFLAGNLYKPLFIPFDPLSDRMVANGRYVLIGIVHDYASQQS